MWLNKSSDEPFPGWFVPLGEAPRRVAAPAEKRDALFWRGDKVIRGLATKSPTIEDSKKCDGGTSQF